MDVRDYPAFRVIAAGTQNGTLNVAIIPRNRATNELQHAEARNHSIILFSPITSLAIFTSRVLAYNSQGKRMRHGRVDGTISEKCNVDNGPGINEDVSEEEEEDVHLLMTCAIEQAWVYTAINRNGLTKRSELAACGNHDSILASYVMDIDWDGENELVIGTYGRQLMVFKQVRGYFVHQASVSSDATLRYELYWNRRFAYPVYGISSADMNNDGLEELVVTTMYGISFFQADTTAAKRRLARAINKMTEIERIRLRLERLRAENLQLESEAEAQILRIQAAEQEEDSTEEADEQEKVEKEEKELEVPDECAVEGNQGEKGVSSVTGNEVHESTSEAEQSKDTFALESADPDNKANNHLDDQQSQDAMLAPSSQGEAADTIVESSLSPACSSEHSDIQDGSRTDGNTKFNPGDLSDISKSKSELGSAQEHG
ncbi:hypothetical protein BGW42_006447 [Actinomortierella wolfii]|nr:hypothetical protein BGW42_006447 [Actinomortierella wolfii]